MNNKITNYFGIFSLSASILIFELLLIRIFSVVLRANLSFFAITITLLGVAIGGLIVFIGKNHFSKENYSKRIFQYTISLGISLAVFPIVFFKLNFVNINNINFFAIILISVIPFILGNIAIVLLFRERSNDIKKIYFFDLVGAGIGVIIAIILMNNFGAINGLFFSSILSLLASFIFISKNYKYRTILLFCLIIVITGTVLNINFDFIKITNTKVGIEDNNVIFKKWNSFSRITVHNDISKNGLPKMYRLLIDSDAATNVIKFDGDLSKISYLKNDITSAPYHTATPGTSLIIGPGGGRDVLSALLFNFRVVGVEINPIIIDDVMKNKLKDFSGNLYGREDVDIVVSEGRSFLEKNTNTYSVIHIPLVDTWSSTVAGNLTLVESYLYTVEAFDQYLKHLKPNGMLSFTRWELDGMRLISLYFEASEKLGISSPEKNIAIISRDKGKYEQLNNYLFKKEPFTTEEIKNLENFANEAGYTIIYTPTSIANNDYSQYINTSDRKNFINNYSINIEPVYDNNPFYFFTSPINKNINLARRNYGVTFLMIFIFTLIVTVLITVLPLFIKRNDNKIENHKKWQSFSLIIYFSLLGLGFLLLELTLIQKFILYLEQPIYSYSVVLIALLVSAGAGSFTSEKISSKKKINFFKIALIIFSLIIISLQIIDPIIKSTIDLDIFNKIIISLLINIPIAFFMGMLFPMGIKRLELINRNDLIPWAWAANGAMSVLASVLAMLLAIIFGLRVVMIISSIIYIITPLTICISPAMKEINPKN